MFPDTSAKLLINDSSMNYIRVCTTNNQDHSLPIVVPSYHVVFCDFVFMPAVCYYQFNAIVAQYIPTCL